MKTWPQQLLNSKSSQVRQLLQLKARHLPRVQVYITYSVSNLASAMPKDNKAVPTSMFTVSKFGKWKRAAQTTASQSENAENVR